MSKPKLKEKDKPFDISKWRVVEAYEKVKANKGAAGVDEESIADFERDLKGNLYKIWLCRARDYAEWVAPGLSRGWSDGPELSEGSA